MWLATQLTGKSTIIALTLIIAYYSLMVFVFHQVWEFDQAHQRWLPVAQLGLPSDKGDEVYAVAWAQNIGR